jgi:hypothetical protein
VAEDVPGAARRLAALAGRGDEVWKERFAELWPEGNEFYAPLTGIQPGEVALIKAVGPAGLKLSTGVMVLYADEESFTEMTPEGHMFAGWITFSAYEQDGTPVAQAQILMRSQDPLTELGLFLGGHRMENRFWERTLTNLTAYLGAAGMRLAPAPLIGLCGDFRRKRHVQAAVLLRVQVGELAAGLERLGRPARGPFVEHEGERARHRDEGFGPAHPSQRQGPFRELPVDVRRRGADTCACGRGPIVSMIYALGSHPRRRAWLRSPPVVELVTRARFDLARDPRSAFPQPLSCAINSGM